MAASLVNFVVIFLLLVYRSTGDLTPEGCPDGWNKSPSLEICYRSFLESTTARGARESCEALGARLISIWNEEEFNFIKNHVWQGELTAFSWTGLQGSDRGVWHWQDGSPADVQYTWPESIISSSTTCGSLYGAETWDKYPVYGLDCVTVYTQSFICKMASTVVYSREPPLDRQGPLIGREARFTRLWSPILTRVPPNDVWLGNQVVASDIDCALLCLRTDVCQGFYIRCRLSAKLCGRYLCRPLAEL